MKTDSTLDTEMTIYISGDELCSIYDDPLRGKVQFWDGEKPFERELEMAISHIHNACLIDLKTLPHKANFDKITEYKVQLSLEGFMELWDNGYVSDRPPSLSGSRVDIHVNDLFSGLA